MSQIVLFFFSGKSKKNHAVIGHIFVVNRDNHDSRQKNHESLFHLPLVVQQQIARNKRYVGAFCSDCLCCSLHVTSFFLPKDI